MRRTDARLGYVYTSAARMRRNPPTNKHKLPARQTGLIILTSIHVSLLRLLNARKL